MSHITTIHTELMSVIKAEIDIILLIVSQWIWYDLLWHLGDNCIVFENFTASIGDLMVANWVYTLAEIVNKYLRP